jgi:uncharacterized membrane protein
MEVDMSEEQDIPEEATRFFPDIQEVEPDAPIQWLKKGWEDLKACPSGSLFYGACFVFGGYLMIFSLRDAPEYIAAVITGFVIAGPFLALGLYELSAQRERGEACSLKSSMLACRKNVGNMGVFALLLLVVYLVWARASVVVFAVFYSGALPSMGDFFRHLVMTEQADFLIVYFGVGALFGIIIFAISIISIPLIKDKQMDAVTAAIASVRAVFLNLGPMIVWAGIIAVLSMLGMVTLLLGTLVIGPLLGHATWHAYRDLTGTTVEEG